MSTCLGLGGQPGLELVGGRGDRGSCRDRLGERSGLSNCTVVAKVWVGHPTAGCQHPCQGLGGHLTVLDNEGWEVPTVMSQ